MSESLGNRAAARIIGCSHVAIAKAIKCGHLATLSNGRIALAELERWNKNRRPSPNGNLDQVTAQVTAPAPVEVAQS